MKRLESLLRLAVVGTVSQRNFFKRQIGVRSAAAAGLAVVWAGALPALADSTDKMFWVDHVSNAFYYADLDGSNLTEFTAPGLTNSISMAVDYEHEKFYWTNYFGHTIKRVNWDGTGLETLMTFPSTRRPGTIALDLSAGKMYWMDWSQDQVQYRIRRANLNGASPETLVMANTSGAVLIGCRLALDLVGNKIYWTIVGSGENKIRRANLNGSGAEDLNIFGFGQAWGIALDLTSRKLYWSTGIQHEIKRANLDGSNPQTVLTFGPAGTPGDLALDLAHEKIYWAEPHVGGGPLTVVGRANLNGTKAQNLVVDIALVNGLVLNLPPKIASSNPPNCAIDARQPHELDDAGAPDGWSSFDLQFDQNIPVYDASDFAVSVVGGENPPPSIASVQHLGFNRVRVHLQEPIEPGAWTCLRLLAGDSKTCVGFLPGDVDNDGTAGAQDILALIDVLEDGNTPLSIWRMDIDRSEQANPSDILRLIDLLNGAGTFEPWIGATLPACP